MVDPSLTERIVDHLIKENEHLREDLEISKRNIGMFLSQIEELREVIEDIEDFAEKNDDEQTLEFMNLKSTISMMEECFFNEEDEDGSGGYQKSTY